MKPTDILMNEHRVIEQVLSSLEKFVVESRSQKKLEKQIAENTVAFFREFADRCHHGKEEAQLFPMFESRGFDRNAGPTGVMIQEHEIGRAHVRGMAAAIDAAADGNEKALEEFAHHALEFIALLRQHIEKEDNILFPMADQVIPESDQQKLMEQFERVGNEEIGVEVHDKFLAIADELAARFDVPKAKTKKEEGHSGWSCGHYGN